MDDTERRAVASFLSHIKEMAKAEGSYITSNADEALASLWHQFTPPQRP